LLLLLLLLILVSALHSERRRLLPWFDRLAAAPIVSDFLQVRAYVAQRLPLPLITRLLFWPKVKGQNNSED
jgi:hypothetical protein